jgi:hypothetical protein
VLAQTAAGISPVKQREHHAARATNPHAAQQRDRTALDSSVPARIAWDWPISPARYARKPIEERAMSGDSAQRSECERCATYCAWPAQAYCNTLEAAPLAHIGKESPQ